MDSQRLQRVAEVLKLELSELVRLRVKDPRLGFVTITNVEVSPDLRHARVFVSSLGTVEEASRSVEVLSGAAGFLRSELFGKVRMRHIPELSFKVDRSIEHSVRISQVLRELEQKSEQQLKDEPESQSEPEREEP